VAFSSRALSSGEGEGVREETLGFSFSSGSIPLVSISRTKVHGLDFHRSCVLERRGFACWKKQT